jgi:hypothetical protein
MNMTADKQIIIDVCDVSGCENYGETMAKTHNCTLYDEYLRPCKGANCYYKQLKRKEQECERLKETIQLQNKMQEEVCEEKNEELDQLKAENEELKQLKDEDSLRVTQLAMENTLLQKKFEESEYARGNELIKLVGSKTQIEAYKQTLTEIKEIVEGNCKLCLSVDGFKKTDDCGICEYAKILQKISECEVEDDNK